MNDVAKSAFEPRKWRLAHGRELTLGPTGHLMGILNITPDSFSDGGKLPTVDAAVKAAGSMIDAGASILDIGAESTRPGADSVDAPTEQGRLMPVVEAIVAAFPDVLISVDTYRASTAQMAVDAGAHIVNDVWGLQREPEIGEVAARTGAGLVIMHTNREREAPDDVIADQAVYFDRSLEIADSAGVSRDAVVLDPGFGFGKDPEHNMELMSRFGSLHAIGLPWLVGTSRKRFVGHVTDRPVDERDVATAASTALLRAAGAAIFRVHDVAINKDALLMADAMVGASEGSGHV